MPTALDGLLGTFGKEVSVTPKVMTTITPEALREAGKIGFAALKKHKFYEIKEEDGLTVVNLFGDNYRFFLDKKKKCVWMRSQHHFKHTSIFRLCTRNKEWEGIFSFPREIVANVMTRYLNSLGMEAKGNKEIKFLGTQFKIVASQAYNADKRKIAKVFGGILWQILDKEIASLTVKLFGFGATSLDYTLVWNNKEEILDTLRKAPGVLPIWRSVVLRKMSSSDFTLYDIQKNINYPAKVSNFVFPNIIDTVKKSLVDLKPVGWRFLVNSPVNRIAVICKMTDGHDLNRWLNLFAEVGVAPRHTILKKVIECLMGRDLTKDFVALLRAGFSVAAKSRNVSNFWLNEMERVFDWYWTGIVLDNNQRKAPWSWFLRQEREWHRRINVSKSVLEKKVWQSALDVCKIDDYDIIPLTDSVALAEEGSEMRHCVYSYLEDCMDGTRRIFSIRKGKDKVATLELRRIFTTWSAGQIKGYCNANLEVKFKNLARKLAEKYNKV